MNKKESKSLLEVWEWKEKAFKEVENLELKQALKERIKNSILTAQRKGFKVIKLVKR
jgi:predicted XRE-type DNA-binding protein